MLKPNEMATECFCLMVEAPSDTVKSDLDKTSMGLGEYVVEWRRKATKELNDNEDDDECEDDEEPEVVKKMDVFNVKSSISLPEIKCEPFPFLIEADLPTFGTLDKELRIGYVIKNKMKTHAIDVEFMLDENEFFSIGGKKFVAFFSFYFFSLSNTYKPKILIKFF